MTPPEDAGEPSLRVDAQAPEPLEAPEPPGPPEAEEQPWSRLAGAMALVGPLRSLRGFLIPILITVVGFGRGDPMVSLRILPVVLVIALALGLVPWLTTRWRVTTTHLQVRRGLLNRTTSTARLERIRSVDLEASLLHRALGLTTVKVGTGVDDTRIELDSLPTPQARLLQDWLLEHRDRAGVPAERADAAVAAVAEDGDPAASPGGAAPVRHDPPEQLARIDWSWLRFAPLSLARLVVVAGVIGAVSQLSGELPLVDVDDVRSGGEALLELGVLVLVIVGLVVATAGWLAISVIGYVIQWWDLRVVRADGSLRVTAGLFTTRSTTVEEARVRGVRLTEPVLMRPARGAELHALATGVGSGGVTKLLPPSPLAVDREVGSRVLGTGEPLTTRLTGHGGAARRRSHLRALRGAVVPAGALVALAVFADVGGWWLALVLGLLLVLALAAGELSWRNLGHALTAGHLVAGAPSVTRTRTALELDGVIGWVVRESFFQRRAGLVTLVATTAAGPEHVDVVDVRREVALRLADAATPAMRDDLLGPATARVPAGRP